MRFIEDMPKLGDICKIKKFAWLPVSCRNENTNKCITIWLEFYVEVQEYSEIDHILPHVVFEDWVIVDKLFGDNHEA